MSDEAETPPPLAWTKRRVRDDRLADAAIALEAEGYDVRAGLMAGDGAGWFVLLVPRREVPVEVHIDAAALGLPPKKKSRR
jgi:hypothetical protein